MKIITFISFLFSFIFSMQAQLSAPQVFAPGGKVHTAQSFINSYTIGEISVVTTITSPAFILTQGFHQPFEYMTDIENFDSENGITIFPNPAFDFINLKFNNTMTGNLHIIIYNTLGSITHELKNISVNTNFNNLLSIPVQHLATGPYLLKATLENHESNTPQLIYKRFVRTN